MKNIIGIRKKIWIGVFLIFILSLGRGLYWYSHFDGINTHVIISTQYSSIPSRVEVYIDNELYYKNDSLQILYEFTDGKHLSFGFHHLKVIVDGTEEFAGYFIVFPVRWIYIEIQKYRKNYKEDPNWFFVNFTSSPVGLM